MKLLPNVDDMRQGKRQDLTPKPGALARYRSGMPPLTGDQLELLQRARDGLPVWGGSVAIDRLRRDVDLLLALRLVEPACANPYRLTPVGATVLDAVGHRPS